MSGPAARAEPLCTTQEQVGALQVRLTWRAGSPDREIFWAAVHDYGLPQVLDRLPRTATPRIVDVGAHIGTVAVLAALQVPAAVVEAFEMLADNYRLLCRNLADNGVAERVAAHRAVVAEAPGYWAPTDFVRPDPRNTGGASAALAEFTVAPMQQDAVPAVGLGQLIGEREVDLLKLDCEGGEYRAVYGAGAALRRVGMLVGELHVGPLLEARATAGVRWTRAAFLDFLRAHGLQPETGARRAQPYGYTELFLAERR